MCTHTTAHVHSTVAPSGTRLSLACFCPWHMLVALPGDSFLFSVLTDSSSPYSVTKVKVTPLEVLPSLRWNSLFHAVKTSGIATTTWKTAILLGKCVQGHIRLLSLLSFISL